MLASSQSNKPWSVVMSMSRSRGLINEAMALPFPCSGRLLTGAALFFSRDLRSKSREIMDAVEHGQAFTVTRDGHQIGELIPIRRKRRFASRQEFAAMSRNAQAGNLDAFRADQDAAADHEDGDPYDS